MDVTEPDRLLADCLLAGRYRLEAVIGEGGMGVVWRGRDERLGRDVAVKEVTWPPHFTEREQQVACRRAMREAQMAGRLSHRNVVRIYDIVEQDGHPCIVMELLPYKSLRDILDEQGTLPPARAARIGLGVLAALSAAHAEGILHRDVKPANILVGPDGRVVLTDFGIARTADSPTLTADGTVLGSPSYIAPERARGGQAGAGAPADLWGLGASLYTAVEGHPPFERNGALATLTAVVADELEQAAHAGPLQPVIRGLLRKDPALRLSAAEAGELLRRAAEPPRPAPDRVTSPWPVLTRPWPALTGAWAPAHARPRGSLGLLVTLAALVAVAAAVTGLAFALTG
jgi:serine/threonine protein kinase